MNIVTFEIKLKVGFFKTQDYYLTIAGEQIILTPRDSSETERLVIAREELKLVSIISRNLTCADLEIRTPTNTYLGRISPSDDLKELSSHLVQEFGDKFNFQHGNL